MGLLKNCSALGGGRGYWFSGKTMYHTIYYMFLYCMCFWWVPVETGGSRSRRGDGWVGADDDGGHGTKGFFDLVFRQSNW